ncbi:pitrilysin family protein [Winogradskyella sp. KYW1333]|jgi:predicted Zn-dependent peptidase|uniref:M16 family metallopeptidase n=1 Tax=Winogradskyella sp. KYW1333 TaxID=2282123 RepID=UPI000DF330E8|nr:pitrilysin family protein [Winogradskyella sp. KYW1333]RCT53510.1 insulinase family protein [Winogradskyella sp. KYW1333]
MKKYIIFTLLAVFMGATVTAQVDRTKIPESGPMPEVNLGEAKEFKLKNGLTVLVVTDSKLPSLNWNLNLNNPPVYEGDKAGVQSLTSALMGKETQLTSKDDFSEKIDFLGASMNVSPNGGFGFCLSKYTDQVFSLFAEATLQPKFTQEELDFEKEQLIEGIKSGENSAAAIAGNVRSALLYGKNHAAGEIITEETVNNVTLEDVNNFYKERFKPSNGYILFSGDISEKQAKSLLKKYFGDWDKGSVETPEYPSFYDVPTTEINFVDVPNAVQTELAVMSVSPLKMTDEDYHAALVTNYILGGAFGSYLNMNLREANGYTYGARSSLGTGRYYNSSFRATTKVRNEVTDSAVVETLKEIKRIKTEPVDEEILANAKAKFLGSFILESEDKAVAARRALSIRTNKLPEDFYKNYIANIDKVTIEDVQRVANKYLSDDKARIVLVGKAADVLENVEKIEWNGKKLPVKYFDKEANPTDRPETIVLPEGLTAKSVLENYLSAVGVKDNLESITSVMTQYEATTPMGAVMQEEKRIDGKTNQSIYVSGNKMMSMTMTQEGATANNQPLPANMTNDVKINAGLFMEINLLNSDYAKLTGIEKVEDKDAYVVQVSGEVISYTLYYDVESGLKVKEVQTTSMGGQTQSQDAVLKDYKEYSGLKFPETRAATMMGQSVEFKLKEVKINEGVSDQDFD